MDVLNDDHEFRTIGGYDLDTWSKLYSKKDQFRKGISWHIPSQSLIDCLVDHSPIVSVGSGLGFTEKKAIISGANIVMTDIAPSEHNLWCKPESNEDYREIISLGAKEAVLLYPDRNVFMAWPPYDDPMAFEVANAMQVGRFLIYVGESEGGCTGDASFFQLLRTNFIEIEDNLYVPSWSGIYDSGHVYQKVK